jgi:hypothetical protein
VGDASNVWIKHRLVLIEYKSPLAICDKGGFAFDYVEGAILGPMREGFSMMMLVGAWIPENQAKLYETDLKNGGIGEQDILILLKSDENSLIHVALGSQTVEGQNPDVRIRKPL